MSRKAGASSRQGRSRPFCSRTRSTGRSTRPSGTPRSRRPAAEPMKGRTLGSSRFAIVAGLFAILWPAVLPPPAASQEIQYYHSDAVGNVRLVTDATGNVIERHDYQPFGEECT